MFHFHGARQLGGGSDRWRQHRLWWGCEHLAGKSVHLLDQSHLSLAFGAARSQSVSSCGWPDSNADPSDQPLDNFDLKVVIRHAVIPNFAPRAETPAERILRSASNFRAKSASCFFDTRVFSGCPKAGADRRTHRRFSKCGKILWP